MLILLLFCYALFSIISSLRKKRLVEEIKNKKKKNFKGLKKIPVEEKILFLKDDQLLRKKS